MQIKNEYIATLLFFLIGFLILHPLTMIIGHIMHSIKTNELEFGLIYLFSMYMASFSPVMIPWGFTTGLLSGFVGYYIGSIKVQRALLNSQKELLKQANDTKDKFFSIIAHDLKSPFFSLTGYAHVLLEKYDKLNEAEKIKYITIIKESADLTHKLLENLLEWARMQSGKLEFNICRLNLSDLVSETIDLLRASADKKQIKIESFIEEKVWLEGDRNMLLIVIRNLLANAIKYTNENGKITFKTEQKGNFEVLSITDTGIGMSEDELKKLFRIDIKSTKPGTADEKGTGLGLILCKEFIDLHKGKLEVKSQTGFGTSFIISIPVKKNSIH